MMEMENTGRRIGRGGRVRGMRVGRFSRAGMALTGRYFVLRQPLSLPLFLSLSSLSLSLGQMVAEKRGTALILLSSDIDVHPPDT